MVVSIEVKNLDWKNQGTEEFLEIKRKLNEYGELPKHLAIIMDGNGRWALERNLPRIAGHREGIESVRDIVKAASNLGITCLTLYAFSIENWNRPAAEVTGLMKLLEIYLRKEIEELDENGVRLTSIGKMSALPKNIQKILHESIEKTADNTGLNLNLALSYSGRWDIVRAVQMIGLDVRRGKISPEDINEELFSGYLQTNGMPEPDLLIRTSGEMRLSNFLLWEMAYGEIFISNKYWPEFRKEDLYDALNNFVCRERRYGKTSLQIALENENNDKKQDSYLKRVVDAFKK